MCAVSLLIEASTGPASDWPASLQFIQYLIFQLGTFEGVRS